MLLVVTCSSFFMLHSKVLSLSEIQPDRNLWLWWKNYLLTWELGTVVCWPFWWCCLCAQHKGLSDTFKVKHSHVFSWPCVLIHCYSFLKRGLYWNTTISWGYKTLSMLSSGEPEMCPAGKSLNAWHTCIFHGPMTLLKVYFYFVYFYSVFTFYIKLVKILITYKWMRIISRIQTWPWHTFHGPLNLFKLLYMYFSRWKSASMKLYKNYYCYL